ncbi:MAG: multicopper oxidase family protein [Longimicrobiales bacterium]
MNPHLVPARSRPLGSLVGRGVVAPCLALTVMLALPGLGGAWGGAAGQEAGPRGMGGACPLPVPLPTTPARAADGVPGPAWDLRCIELFPTASAPDARGVVRIRRPPSPFAVTVTADGYHVHDLDARIEGLPDPASLGPYTTYVAWATPLILEPVVRLSEVSDGVTGLGRVDFAKYLIIVSAEASADVTERAGPMVLRGRSPSSRMEAHDLLATAPGAESGPAMGDPGAADGAHEHGMAGAGDGWAMPPGYPGVPMLPGIMALRPEVLPLLLEVPGARTLPEARPREVVALPDGGTLDLTAGFVRRTIAGRSLAMLAFNGQHPGPLIQVDQNTTIFVNFTNETPFPTAVHWHGIRLDNRYDGVPGVTQEPVQPGASFRYTIHFPDAGIYWYHPHHREDVQQELGLAGNMLVQPLAPDAYGPVNREEVLMLDDLLLEPDGGVVPFGREAANYALMGRFGNQPLVNGEPFWEAEVARGEVVRFHLTNASNTRTWNLSFLPDDRQPGPDGGFRDARDPERPATDVVGVGSGAPPLPIKVVASDVGRFEREAMVESVVLAPAERYVVDVRFPEAGRYVLTNRVVGINHRRGTFLPEAFLMGRVSVAQAAAVPELADAFRTLRVHDDVVADIDRFRSHFDRPVDRELVLALEADSLPDVIEQSMRYDWVFFNPVEWTGTMPMMNWAVSADQVRWTIREPATGRADMDIDWRFRVGDVVKIRVHNDRASFHAMQHPLHIHGQRFLVLSQDGVTTDNLVWKDTVLLPAGSVTDLLLEVSNPGRWMVHCHIAEHLEAGMKFVFDVER